MIANGFPERALVTNQLAVKTHDVSTINGGNAITCRNEGGLSWFGYRVILGHDLDPKTRATIENQGDKIRIFETARTNSGKPSARDIVINTDGKSIAGSGILYHARRLTRKFK